MKFDCVNAYGKQVNINQPIRGELIGAINDPANPRRAEAARILKVYENIASKPVTTELDRAVQTMMAENDCEGLWKGGARLQTQMGIDGVSRDVIAWN
jgi:hypothetical protein